MSRSVVSDFDAAQVPDQVLDQVPAQVPDQVLDQVLTQVPDQVLDQVPDQISAQVPAQGSDEDPHHHNHHNHQNHQNHHNQIGLTEHPLVSAIIPAYNAQGTISATLQSLVGQSYPHLEIIVTDDGSNDQTVQIVRGWMERDSRIKLLQQANAGVGAARNLAIGHCRGSFVAPVDADDICYPEKIERLLAALQKAGDRAGLAYSWSAIIDHAGRIKGAASRNEFEGPVYEYLFLSNFIGNASACLIRKNCFERVGLYNTRLFSLNAQGCEDFDMFLRISEHFEFKLVKAYLTGYRKAGNGMSNRHSNMERSKILVYQDQKARHPWIPDVVVHWALAYYLLWLSRKAAENASLPDTLRYLVKAAYYDPKLIQNPDYIRMLLGHIRRSAANMPGMRAFHGGSETRNLFACRARALPGRKRRAIALPADTLQPIEPVEPIEPLRNFSIRDLEYAHERLNTRTSLAKLKEERRATAARILRKARLEHGRLHPNAPSIGFDDHTAGGESGEQGARPSIVLLEEK